PPKWLTAVAEELSSSGNRGRALVVVGSRQPPAVHALAHAINAALGGVGNTLTYSKVADPDELDAVADLQALTDAMGAGQVDALLILGGNPAYDAPADLAFAEKLAKVPFTVHSSLFFDETSEKCAWHLPRAHELESWGDAQSLDGTVAIQQPLLAPLYGGRSDIDLLLSMARAVEANAHEAVRETIRAHILDAFRLTNCGPFNEAGKAECRDSAGNPATAHRNEVERQWNRALATGVTRRPPGPVQGLAVRQTDVAAAIEKRPVPGAPAAGTVEVTFAPCPKMFDGRHANNTWLQEVPDPETKLVWDNAAIVSPATARELGVASKDLVTISVGPRSVQAAVWVLPGQADRSIALTLGWGRRKAGRIGDGRGFDAYPLRTSDALGFVSGATVKKTGEEYFFAQTQENDSAEGRPIAHEATLATYRQRPNFAELDAPPLRSLPLWTQADYSKGHQWGMSIDLNACTGCSACVVACIAENNVPMVGKREVWRGREMHWLRIDRYYVDRDEVGAEAENPAVIHEPVMCVHCEEAPCENVCPVNATTHGPEGLNEMAYNRCIGTRYCGNNCPYKVRRFNYLNWHNDAVWKETGGLPETLQMQQNPNVTVRFRGVMEKCTYCVQRIQSEKIRAKRELRELRDGQIRTACQQTCPTDAIVFGDVNDANSQVTKLSRGDRRFGLLAELGTRPRTTYLAKVRNPNPEMV
ncbi:MAG: 4Fe-4S dicluster domain-containing protein, partial [Myxococcales bacterium]|nr:4Fe-4S dicluster domain-containing protein [Myxococcales bacterium]